MRVLVITNDFPPVMGGIENYIFSIAGRLDPNEVVVLTRYVRGAEQFDRDLEFTVERVPVGNLLPTRDLLHRAERVIEERAVDVVHFASPLPLALLGPRLLRRREVPYAVTVHGGEFILPSRLPGGRSMLRRALGGAAVLLPVSSFTEAVVRRFFGGSPPTEVVTPGVDPEVFTPDAPARLGPLGPVRGRGPLILSVSRLVSRKGPATLIRSLPSILERHPAARAVIVGGGPDRPRLRRLASSVGVLPAVRFAGPQPWAKVPGYYAAADLFALPTRERFGGLETEGFPLVFLEAAAAGLPVVAGEAGGVRDAVIDGETGHLVDGRDPRATAQAIIGLLDDPVAARAMGERARARVIEGFTWNLVARKFRAALDSYCT